jgi:hypothetical protein
MEIQSQKFFSSNGFKIRNQNNKLAFKASSPQDELIIKKDNPQSQRKNNIKQAFLAVLGVTGVALIISGLFGLINPKK